MTLRYQFWDHGYNEWVNSALKCNQDIYQAWTTLKNKPMFNRMRIVARVKAPSRVIC